MNYTRLQRMKNIFVECSSHFILPVLQKKKKKEKHHKPLLNECVPNVFEVSPALVGHFVFSMWV